MSYLSAEYSILLHAYRQYRPEWGNTGYTWADRVCQYLQTHPCRSVLDYGCGDGSLKTAVLSANLPVVHDLALFRFDEYDPGVKGKDICPEAAYDLVVCKDVLEHIEPAYLQAVLDHLYAITKRQLWCKIALIPAPAVLPDGRNAHLSLLPSQEWLARLTSYAWAVTKDYENEVYVLITCTKSTPSTS